MNHLTKETKLFFLHIPKTAGTSLRSYLVDQYHEKDVLQKYDWLSLNSTDIDELEKYNLIMGHFDYRMVGLLPSGYKTATFLREPVARTISAIRHAMRDARFRPEKINLEGKSFKEIIRDPVLMSWFSNTQVSLLAADCSREVIIQHYVQRKVITDQLPFINDVVFDLKLASARLKLFDFVGIVEQFEQDLLQLADLCEFYPPSTAPLLNKMPQDESLWLDDEDMAILTEQNTLDIALYQQALEISASKAPLQRDACLRKYFSLSSTIATDIQIDLAPPFSGWGFYEFEQENGITYRWSGPHNSSGISIKLAHGHYQIKFKYYLDATQFAQNVEFFIGDKKPEAKVWKEMGFYYCAFTLEIVNHEEIIDFTFKTDRTLQSFISNNNDLRSLGFMLIDIVVCYETTTDLTQPKPMEGFISAEELCMNGEMLEIKALEFSKVLSELKIIMAPEFPWYPYGILNNFIHLKDIFNQFPLDQLASCKHIADIGAADGDLAFFMQSLGFSIDIIDYAPTNYNGLRGARAIIEKLNIASSVQVYEMNIDDKCTMPNQRYGVIFFLGILYHLKNPYYILENLSKISAHLILSTRVARYTPDGRLIEGSPVAYLVDDNELNNDATNFWIFSQSALNRLVSRAGWSILYSKSVGDTISSNPSDQDKDERCFMILRSNNTQIANTAYPA